MHAKKDWIPNTRQEIHSMAVSWASLMAANGAAWNIPPEVPAAIAAAAQTAEAALVTVHNEATRTPVASAACKTAFRSLIALLRSVKRKYVCSPPMTDADIISLGLKPHKANATPAAAPTAQVTVEPFLAGWHEIGIRFMYLFGEREPGPKFGYRVYYRVMENGEAAPSDPGELHCSYFTSRPKDVIKFDFADSGKTVWIAVQTENNGLKGPWGPLVCAVIP